MNGGAGRCVNGFSSTLVTVQGKPAHQAFAQLVGLRFGRQMPHPVAGQLPRLSKSLPVATRSP